MQGCGQSGMGGTWSVYRFDNNLQNGGCGQIMGAWVEHSTGSKECGGELKIQV